MSVQQSRFHFSIQQKLKNFHSVFLLLFLALSSCSREGMINTDTADKLSGDIATQWMSLTISLTKNTGGFSPPVASRAFGYCGIALWESIAQQVPNGRSVCDQLAGSPSLPLFDSTKNYYPPACVNAAMYFITKKMYATAPASMIKSIDSLYQANNAAFESVFHSETIDNSNTYGTAIANAIYEWSKTDGGHEGYLDNHPINYINPLGPGNWEPTTAQRVPVLPYWGSNRTFIQNIISTISTAAPDPYSTDTNSFCFKEAMEVYNTSKSLTDYQRLMADYWNDATGTPGTPPGHSISIVAQLVAKENLPLSRAASLYCKAGIGVSDAFVSCWNAKYKYNRMRPVTFIKKNIDSTWNSYIQTPNFPEYTSGHSTQSGAIAEILNKEFGYNYAFTDATHQHRPEINGAPRSFNSFNEFAEECAMSRLYGGIHYRQAITIGLEVGKKIGTRVSELKFYK